MWITKVYKKYKQYPQEIVPFEYTFKFLCAISDKQSLIVFNVHGEISCVMALNILTGNFARLSASRNCGCATGWKAYLQSSHIESMVLLCSWTSYITVSFINNRGAHPRTYYSIAWFWRWRYRFQNSSQEKSLRIVYTMLYAFVLLLFLSGTR